MITDGCLEGRPASTQEVDDPEGQKAHRPTPKRQEALHGGSETCVSRSLLEPKLLPAPRPDSFDVGTARQFSHVIALRACQLMRPQPPKPRVGTQPK